MFGQGAATASRRPHGPFEAEIRNAYPAHGAVIQYGRNQLPLWQFERITRGTERGRYSAAGVRRAGLAQVWRRHRWLCRVMCYRRPRLHSRLRRICCPDVREVPVI
jgi:hypothetical protein